MNNSIWKLMTTGILLLLLTGISACGQKGDLYLPPEEVSQQQPAEISHV
ncbi:MAG: lipoprotein [Gammaproteobacteria bacterium]